MAALIAISGVALRANEIGAFGFSNDEAWVALSTRVAGFAQAWLAIAMTPVAWAGLVHAFSLASASEAALRAVPLLFGALTLAVAYRAGARFAEHPLGGVFAVAAVAFDPLSIAFSKILKQYTAEAFFCLLAIDAALRAARSGRRRDLGRLVVVLVVGCFFANSQVFVAPPALGAVLVDAALRRDRRRATEASVATGVVGLVALLVLVLLVSPRLPDSTDRYWGAQVYLPVSVGALTIAWQRLGFVLVPALGWWGFTGSAVALVLCGIARERRVAAIAIGLLVLELVAASMLRIVPLSQPRVLLFATTAIAAYGAAALAVLLRAAWARPRLRVAAAAGLLFIAVDFAQVHRWRTLGRPILVEDAAPLVRRLESARGPDDRVIVHSKATFLFAHYQRATPVLDPSRGASTGYIPRLPDDRVVRADDRTLVAATRAALRQSPRVWVLVARKGGQEHKKIAQKLASLGRIVDQRARREALLIELVAHDSVPRPNPSLTRGGGGAGRFPPARPPRRGRSGRARRPKAGNHPTLVRVRRLRGPWRRFRLVLPRRRGPVRGSQGLRSRSRMVA